MFEAPEKHSLGHLRAVKQLKTVALDLEEIRELILRPQSIQLHISRIFHVSKQNECELLNCKTIGTLGQMAITHFKQ